MRVFMVEIHRQTEKIPYLCRSRFNGLRALNQGKLPVLILGEGITEKKNVARP
jgi:hypothetical protein